MGFQDPIVGGIALRKPAIRSPNYVAGVSGWTINIDGSVEFNSGTFRGTVTAGTFQGTNFIINSSGIFLYSGTPATGNLIISIASLAGTDSFGNVYPKGINVSGGGLINIPAAASSGVALTAQVFADPFSRFVLQVDGTMNWGSGAVTQDTRLYRPQTGQLNTDTAFSVGTRLKIGTYAVKEVAAADAVWQIIGVGGAPAYKANWSASTTFHGLTVQGLQARLTIEDEVWLYGCATAAAGAGTTVTTLAAGYFNATNATAGELMLSTAAGVESRQAFAIDTAGNVLLPVAAVTGDNYFWNVRLPLGNMP
jgi:hypothetical protein